MLEGGIPMEHRPNCGMLVIPWVIRANFSSNLARDANVYKVCKLIEAILSVF